MIIDDLIFDRVQNDTDRLNQLLKIPWRSMTQGQKDEYLGLLSALRDSNIIDLYDSQNEQLFLEDSIQKGAYNYTDLNRVETAVAYVAGELVEAHTTLQAYATSKNVAWANVYDVPYDPTDYSAITTVTTWEASDIPSVSEMTRYLGNVKLIHDAYLTDDVLPSSMNELNWSSANTIEKTLKDVHLLLLADIVRKKKYIDSAATAWKSGDLYSGEV